MKSGISILAAVAFPFAALIAISVFMSSEDPLGGTIVVSDPDIHRMTLPFAIGDNVLVVSGPLRGERGQIVDVRRRLCIASKWNLRFKRGEVVYRLKIAHSKIEGVSRWILADFPQDVLQDESKPRRVQPPNT